jgi:heme/copper-type cytochrome/quinol oxidase subunit 4
MFASAVFLLCAGTSAACAWLLLRGYFRNHVRLLLFSGLCFVGLTLDNLILFLDMIIFPLKDLSAFRSMPGLVGVALLVCGLIWESK